MTVLKHVDFEVPNWAELAQGPQTQGGYRAQVMADNPIRYYRLGESGGTAAIDETAGNTAATYKNNPTLGAAGLLDFDADTAVQFGSSSLLDSGEVLLTTTDGAQPYTFEFWFQTTYQSGSINLLAQFVPNNPDRWQIFLTASGSVHYRLANVNLMIDAGAYNDGKRHHGVATKAANGDLALWIDAVLRKTTTNAHVFANTTFTIGARTTAGVGSFAGVLDEVAIYASVLDASRITAHYHAGIGKLTA